MEEPKQIVQEGAPDWVVTFGDLMSLLLCFFVLLLSFSEMDKAKYKEVAGSLSKAFGVQRKTKAFEAPKGIKMIARDFDQEPVPTKIREEYLVTQEREFLGRELRQEIESEFSSLKDLIEVEVGADAITIRLMGESTFDSGKAQIRREMVPLLRKIASILNRMDGEIIVAGHTDNVPIRGGPFRDNLSLSIARAATVANFMIRRESIRADRVATMGFGEFRPRASNKTEGGREKNRRVEIILGGLPLK